MTKKKDKKLIVVFLLLSFYLLSLILSLNINFNFANAQETIYSNVLSDLQKDESFKKEDYPVVENDFSLKVIQIAESEDKELFVYVYQPCPNEDLKATTINISTSIDNNLNFKNYKLGLINSKDVFCKFKVLNFDVSEDMTRYYEISSIYRAWQEDIDEPVEGDNTVSEVAFAVNSLWTAETENNTVTYECFDIETIEITDKYVGFVRYFGGNSYVFCLENCDSHFVAFSTNKQIDKLKEADVYFKVQKVHYESGLSGVDDWDFFDVEDNYSYITENDTAFYKSPSSTWQGYSYSWSRIQTIDEFFETNDFKNVYKGSFFNQKVEYTMDKESKEYMKNMQWVLRFYETSYEKTNAPYPTKDYEIVSDVSILRLKFETEGKVYNLGVIDNKQTGDGDPDNIITVKTSWPWWVNILIIIACVVVLAIFAPWIIQLLFKIIWWILKAVCWLLTSPFYVFKK